ncbi:MAG: hypothetical protein KatS3mg110_1163 [Pirellulaceae bacterium]|nr:MAG: hypothetical protein KatS3mg110_1163 [Pirellulaceae bacterium]
MFVYLLATLDTKGQEAAFVKRRLEELRIPVRLVDAGSLGEPAVVPDIARDEVFRAAGSSWQQIAQQADRGTAVATAARGAAILVREAHRRGELGGVLALGGSAGTTIGTTAMRELPIGVPKIMISTLASGQVRPYVRDKDIVMFNSIVDLAGINRISRLVLANAAAAMAGMFQHPPAATGPDRPLVVASMFGVTTPCVQRARQVLEEAGYEVLVFHATGNGGQAMESLIREGLVAGVLDITTTELADELVGGVLSAGPDRLTAAAQTGTPQVVSVGALDMVNFGPPETVPERFRGRRFHQHNPTVTLMRTTVQENRQLGEEIGRKLAAARGPVTILLPARGVSALDREGQPFDDPQARQALFSAIQQHCGSVPCRRLDLHINDSAFAETAAGLLLAMMRDHAARQPAGNDSP